MDQSETRAALLKELATYASASFVECSSQLSTDEQIRQNIAAAKEHIAYYREIGVEDMSLTKKGERS
jgi:hypothetical protein